jgi:hypothetical protein
MTEEQRPGDWFAHFDFTERQRSEALDAWTENPWGTRQVMRAAFRANNPVAEFLERIRRREHTRPSAGAKLTGWRFVRGSHSGTYVEDPWGTDPLPPGYEL